MDALSRSSPREYTKEELDVKYNYISRLESLAVESDTESWSQRTAATMRCLSMMVVTAISGVTVNSFRAQVYSINFIVLETDIGFPSIIHLPVLFESCCKFRAGHLSMRSGSVEQATRIHKT